MKIKNSKTNEELTFSDDWKIVALGEKKKAKIKGQEFIDLFKQWARVNTDFSFCEYEKNKKKYVYRRNKDMLFFDTVDERRSFGIGFYTFTALEDLKDGEVYSYNDLVGEA